MQKYYVLFWTNPGSSIAQNSSFTAIYLPSYKPSKWDMRDTAGKVKTKSYAMFSKRLQNIDALSGSWMLFRSPTRYDEW